MQPKFNIKRFEEIIDNKIFEFTYKHLYEIFIIVVSILALFIRYTFIEVKSADYDVYICKWGSI